VSEVMGLESRLESGLGSQLESRWEFESVLAFTSGHQWLVVALAIFE
jgi:hypothetical protein